MRTNGVTNFQRSVGAPPATPVAGDTYYDTTAKIAYVYDGTAWAPIAPASGGWPSRAPYPGMALMDYMGANPGWSYLNGVCEARFQTNHGFVFGNILKFDGSTYSLAMADTEANAEVCGMVINVLDANQFVMLLHGNTAVANQTFTGLGPGTIYYLSDTIPGAMDPNEPITPGHVSKPLMQASSAGGGWFFNMRGVVIPDTYSKPWDLPWGAVPNGTIISTTLQVANVVSQDLPGMTVTFDAIAGRLYKYSFNTLVVSSVGTDRIQLGLRNGANAQISSAQKYPGGTSQSTLAHSLILPCPWSNLISEGSNTLKLYGWRLAGTGNVQYQGSTGDPAMLTVEDVGPVSGVIVL